MNSPLPPSTSEPPSPASQPGKSVPAGPLPPTETSSSTSIITRQPILGILISLAVVGALTLIYQVLLVLSDTALWILVALTCTILVVAYCYWWPSVKHSAHSLPGSIPSTESAAKPQKAGWDWTSTLGFFVFLAFLRGMMGNPQPPHQNFKRPIGGSAISDPQAALRLFQQRQATGAYWQTAVASLHALRFSTPSDAESTQGAFERLSRELQHKVEQARAASTTNVDAELIALVRRHLELDNRMLKILSQIPTLMKTYQAEWGTDSAAQSAVQWQEIQAKLISQPELWEKLPPDAQQLINDIVELEQQQQEQFREIELMQAVLKERYKGLAFPLPTITP